MPDTDIILIGASWGAEPGDVVTVDEERAETLVASGAARYPYEGELKSGGQGVDDVLVDVGDDKDKAQAALDAEKAKTRPRTTLVSKLEAIIAGS